MKKISLLLIVMLAGIAAAKMFFVGPALVMAIDTTKMCRDKTYQATINKIATQGDLQISLTAQLLAAPAETTFTDVGDIYVIEYIPDANATTATFCIEVTFDPNMCIEPATRIWERTYEVLPTIPAPEVPIRPFVAVSQ